MRRARSAYWARSRRAASVIVVIAAGWYSQRLLARGISSRIARGIFGGVCVALGGAALTIMPYVPSIALKIALTTAGVALPSVIYVISNAVVSEITPVAQRGALLAIGTAVGTSAGLLAPYVMGSVVESGSDAARRLQHRVYDLRHHHACRRCDSDGAGPPGARDDALVGRDAGGGSRVCLSLGASYTGPPWFVVCVHRSHRRSGKGGYRRWLGSAIDIERPAPSSRRTVALILDGKVGPISRAVRGTTVVELR